MAKILVADDNMHNRRLLKDLLEFSGHLVYEAEDGEAAIALAKLYTPDLILMDLQMPKMDGFKALSMLKQDKLTQSIKVLAVTSYAMKGDIERVMSAGFDGYLAKPVNTRAFVSLISSILKR